MLSTPVQRRLFGKTVGFGLSLLLALAVAGCASSGGGPAARSAGEPPNKAALIAGMQIVDCLLPGQVRSVGNMTYMTQRRPIRTTASDCHIRGGEYVAYDRADYKTALKVWLPAAKAGDAKAQVQVGQIFEQGLGTSPNYKLAVLWYQKAAAQGNDRGLFNLATMYERGKGVSQNKLKALNLYRRAWGMPANSIIYEDAARAQRAKLAAGLHVQLQQKNAQLNALRNQVESLKRELKRSSRNAQASAGMAQQIDALQGLVNSLSASRTDLQQKLAALPSQQAPAPVSAPAAASASARSPSQNASLKRKIADLQAQLQAASVSATASAEDKQAMNQKIATLQGRVAALKAQAENQQPSSSKPYVVMRTPTRRAAAPASGTPLAVAKVHVGDMQFGRYYALVIADDTYSKIADLSTPVSDATAVAKVLKDRYGFEVETLFDADRFTTMKAISQLYGKLGKNDNLLIYYAGHGDRVRLGDRDVGYWLPTNADAPPNNADWVPNAFVTGHLGHFKAKRVLVIADSCYAGLLSSTPGFLNLGGSSTQASSAFIHYKLPRRSRLLLASGGDQPVVDSAGGHHSIFTGQLLRILRSNNGILTADELFARLQTSVEKRAAAHKLVQEPVLKAIKGAGHEAGGFFFVPRTMTASIASGS